MSWNPGMTDVRFRVGTSDYNRSRTVPVRDDRHRELDGRRSVSLPPAILFLVSAKRDHPAERLKPEPLETTSRSFFPRLDALSKDYLSRGILRK